MLERLLACEHKPEACAAHSFVMGPAVVNNNKASLEGLRGVEGLRGGLPSKGEARALHHQPRPSINLDHALPLLSFSHWLLDH